MVAGIVSMPPIGSFFALLFGGLLAMGFGMGGFAVGIIIVLGFIPAALISGIIAARRTRVYPHQYGGRGLAITGIVCSSIGMVIVPVTAAIAIPNLLASRRAANEALAIRMMQNLEGAQQTAFATTHPGGICVDIPTLIKESLIEREMQAGEKSGYRYQIVNLPGRGCEINATPLTKWTGTRSFYISTNEGVIRAAAKNGRPASQLDPPVDVNPGQRTGTATTRSKPGMNF
jgi:type II secretory pathway pseudopilin PulG